MLCENHLFVNKIVKEAGNSCKKKKILQKVDIRIGGWGEKYVIK